LASANCWSRTRWTSSARHLRAGGLSECKKIADMAGAFGVRYNPHVWGTGIAIAASLQLLAVVPTHTPTSLAPVEPILEFDRTEHPIRQAVLTRPLSMSVA
jgi:D-galactarolactone cycloisomerase